MREAVIVASARTPLARSSRGSFHVARPDDLVAHAISAALRQGPELDSDGAFASQLLCCQRELDIPDEKPDPLGGSISIGHPYGMTGSRMTGPLPRPLRRTGQKRGIVTPRVGGGTGAAGLFEAR